MPVINPNVKKHNRYCWSCWTDQNIPNKEAKPRLSPQIDFHTIPHVHNTPDIEGFMIPAAPASAKCHLCPHGLALTGTTRQPLQCPQAAAPSWCCTCRGTSANCECMGDDHAQLVGIEYIIVNRGLVTACRFEMLRMSLWACIPLLCSSLVAKAMDCQELCLHHAWRDAGHPQIHLPATSLHQHLRCSVTLLHCACKRCQNHGIIVLVVQ